MRTMLRTVLLCVPAICGIAMNSCSKDSNISRSEVVRFYSPDAPQKSVTYLQIPLEGISDGVMHIESNTPIDVETQLSVSDMLSDESWITFDVTKESDRNYVVRYSAKALEGDLSQRAASVNATSTQLCLGSYLKICQGYELFWTNVFTDMEHLVLDASGKSWRTSAIPNIAATSFDYISFNAYAVNPDAASMKEVYPLELSIPEGTYFDSNARTSFVVDVPLGDTFGDENLIYLPFRSVAGGFSSETAVKFSSLCEGEVMPQIHVGNIKVYKVSDQLREILEGEDFGDIGDFDSFE